MCHYELHIEQFDLFLEEQSFTYRRNKDTKEDVKRSSSRILVVINRYGNHASDQRVNMYIICQS